jgi:hypothetical protein
MRASGVWYSLEDMSEVYQSHHDHANRLNIARTGLWTTRLIQSHVHLVTAICASHTVASRHGE